MQATQKRIELLFSKWFVLGLFVLILNDHILKYEFSNHITGKLSDVAGLFIFPIFFSAFLFNHKIKIYLFTTIFFILWKLPIAQVFIDLWNNLSIVKINRVEDYTDYFALLVLPLSYKHIKQSTCKYPKINKAKVVCMSMLSVVTFCATSIPRQKFDPEKYIGKSYELEISKEEFFSKVSSNSLIPENNFKDSLFYCNFAIQNNKVALKTIVKIKEKSNKSITVELDSVIEYWITGNLIFGVNKKQKKRMFNLTESEYENHFYENVIQLFSDENNKSVESVYIQSKELVDSLR